MDQSLTKKNLSRKDKINIYIPAVIIVTILLIISFFAGRFSVQKSSPPATSTTSLQPKIKETINKEFLFSVKNDSGYEITKIKYLLESAEIQKSIIIKGQQATAIDGKEFLVLDIKLTNDFNKNIQVNSRDYLRLSIKNKKDLLAPDLHNDPIEVDAISSKETRLGFAIDENSKNVVLHVGEIDGDKTDILLKIFPK